MKILITRTIYFLIIVCIFQVKSLPGQTCPQPVASFYQITVGHEFTHLGRYIAQVFTAEIDAYDFDVTLDLAQCKEFGATGAKIELLRTVNGEPAWDQILDSAFVEETRIFNRPDADCNYNTFQKTVFSFRGTKLQAGEKYVLLLKSNNGHNDKLPNSILWRSGSGYPGGSAWQYQGGTAELKQTDLQFEICLAEIAECKSNVANYITDAFQYSYANQYQQIAQVFTAENDALNISVELELSQCSYYGYARPRLFILSADNGIPNRASILDSAFIGESELFDMAIINDDCEPHEYGACKFYFHGIQLKKGKQYAILLAGIGQYLYWRKSDPTNPYTGGSAWEFSATGALEKPDDDMQFTICGYSANDNAFPTKLGTYKSDDGTSINVLLNHKWQNAYPSVQINNVEWMAENLDVTNFRDGTPIQWVKSETEWNAANHGMQPAWCYYNFDSITGQTYGKLYNWYAINCDKGLAPQGWHIPSIIEWQTLIPNGGGKIESLMEAESWNLPADVQNNNAGFTAIPAGTLTGRINSTFTGLTTIAKWWATPPYADTGKKCFQISTFPLPTGNIESAFITDGLSVRCIKD